MTLRKKTLVVLGITLMGLLIAIYVVSSSILMESFEDIEREEMERNVQRAIGALDDDLGDMEGSTRDWAVWDDTYAFMEDGNQEYIDSNLQLDSSFENNDLNLMLFLDETGQPVYAKGYNLVNQHETPVPAELTEKLQHDSSLFESISQQDGARGLIMLPEGPMLLAAHPVLTSQHAGPSRGVLLWGRFLDSDQIDRFGQISRLSLLLERLNNNNLPADFQTAVSSIDEGSEIFVNPLSDETVAGYGVLTDIFGGRALMLRVDSPRDIFNQGRSTLGFLIVFLLSAGLVFGLTSATLLERMVISRVTRLNADVSEIGYKSDHSARVKTSGSDELSQLGDVINNMLTALESSQKELRLAHDDLELRVRDRTSQLREKVAALETLAEIDREVISVVDPQSILNLVCRRAADLLRAPKCFITLDRPDSDTVGHVAASYGFSEAELKGGRGAPAVMEQGGTCVISRLIAEGSQLGLLLVCDENRNNWKLDEVQVLDILAGQAAMALDEARLFGEEQTRRQELATLYGLSRALADEPPDIDAILDLVTHHAVAKINVSFARVALVESDELVWRTGHPVRVLGGDPRLSQRRRVEAGPFCQKVMEQNQPVIARDSDGDVSEVERECLFLGVAHTLCLVPLRAGDRAVGLLALGEVRQEKREPFTNEKISLASSIGDQTVSALGRAELFEQLEHSYLESVMSLAQAVEAKDTYTHDHGEGLAAMAVALGKSLQMTRGELEDLHYGAILHDVGKIGVPDEILNKPGKLSESEWSIMKKHPAIGARILAPIPRLAMASRIVRHHHERYEGGGYPDGISGAGIPLGARILAVVDSYSAMIDNRVYRPAMKREEVLAELRRCSGSQFDPTVIRVFLELLERGLIGLSAK